MNHFGQCKQILESFKQVFEASSTINFTVDGNHIAGKFLERADKCIPGERWWQDGGSRHSGNVCGV